VQYPRKIDRSLSNFNRLADVDLKPGFGKALDSAPANVAGRLNYCLNSVAYGHSISIGRQSPSVSLSHGARPRRQGAPTRLPPVALWPAGVVAPFPPVPWPVRLATPLHPSVAAVVASAGGEAPSWRTALSTSSTGRYGRGHTRHSGLRRTMSAPGERRQASAGEVGGF
jgi:hypothetical protein